MRMKHVWRTLFAVLLLSAPLNAQQSISTTVCPGAGCQIYDVSGQGTAGVQITGTFVGTLQFEQTIDKTNWATWTATTNNSGTQVTSATATGFWTGTTAGVKQVRVRFSAYTSGTAIVSVSTASAKSASGGNSTTDQTLVVTDNAVNNVTSTAHGFAPKTPADATVFMNGAATAAYAAVKDSDLATTDVTNNNATTTKHGFIPKAPNNTTTFWRGDATYATPMCVTDTCTSNSSFGTAYFPQDGMWAVKNNAGTLGVGIIGITTNIVSLRIMANLAVAAYVDVSGLTGRGSNVQALNIANQPDLTTGGGSGMTTLGAMSTAFEFLLGTAPSSTMVFTPNWPQGSGGLLGNNWYRLTCSDLTTNSVYFDQSTSGTTTVTGIWYSRTTGLATAPTAGDRIICSILGG